MATPTPQPDDLRYLKDLLKEINRRLETLERPTGTQTAGLLNQVQTQLASIDARVTNAIAANSYTKTQIDSKVASPGDIAPGNVTASGTVAANNSTFVSTYARNNQVTTSYVAAYINSDGKFLATASSRRFKRDVATYSGGDWRKIRAVTYKLRSTWILDNMTGGDGSSVPAEIGVIAEELVAAGYPELVVFDDSGQPWSVHYERIAMIAIAAAQELDKRLLAVESKLGLL